MNTQVLGDYNILKKIGQGSLGATYLAEHRFVRKQYVIKVLPEELSNDRSFIQRFEDDIALLARLDHPNIVKIHNVSFSRGSYFLVSDCVVDDFGETTTLDQYFKNKSNNFRENELRVFLTQLAAALDYAHKKQFGDKVGIPHRCLKLNNILISSNDGKTKLVIADFGLSRIIGMSAVLSKTYQSLAEALNIVNDSNKNNKDNYLMFAGDSDKLSMLHNSFLQNYMFLAPEQKDLKKANQVDAKADVYAFGVLTYYLITKQFPTPFCSMPSQIMPEYKMNWDNLIFQCLQQSPQKRPTSLINALKELTSPQNKQVNASIKKFEKVSIGANLSSLTKEEHQNVNRQKMTMSSQGSSTIVHQYSPKERNKENKDLKPILSKMAIIKAGEFIQGSAEGNRDEKPAHKIVLNSFAMDIHPVTNEQFLRFLEYLGGEKDSSNHDLINLKDSRIKKMAGKLNIESGYSKHPVVGVTWYGALTYARWIGKRLPTEAEWETAARGGLENVPFPKGSEIEKSQANFFNSDTIAVMSYPPNEYGLYDMAGNVYDWCHDWYDYNYYELASQEPENPQGPIQGVYRVLRGGCWKSLKDDMRSSHRHRNKPTSSNSTYGFRCAETISIELQKTQ